MMRMPQTQEQVQQEIATLQEIKPRVRRRTLFGDDNHAAIDTQITVLEDGLDEETIYAEWEDNDHLLTAALEALAWRNGDCEAPSGGWRDLVVG